MIRPVTNVVRTTAIIIILGFALDSPSDSGLFVGIESRDSQVFDQRLRDFVIARETTTRKRECYNFRPME